ncbi:hypothetical protein E2P81_ATG00975 [Venturia nashicola]|nr:hypothetical protein E2P81_ATG00975 [Venturia nashicola]
MVYPYFSITESENTCPFTHRSNLDCVVALILFCGQHITIPFIFKSRIKPLICGSSKQSDHALGRCDISIWLASRYEDSTSDITGTFSHQHVSGFRSFVAPAVRVASKRKDFYTKAKKTTTNWINFLSQARSRFVSQNAAAPQKSMKT